jgi:uroporphyrinogen decarboxylase
MRQAGRSLPEYRAIRGTESILEAISRPELAAEITMQPVRRYGVDAAILFSDIVVPLAAIGVGVEIVAGKGPVIADPFRSEKDLARIRPLEASIDTAYVLDTINILRDELDVPLIGFAGAPFTVGSYFIEGGATRTFARTKSLMHNDPALFMKLMDRLADLAIDSLRSQIDAGVNAIQLFDSWAGALSRADYQRFVLPSSTKVLEELEGTGVPRIHFGVDTGEIIDLMAGAGAEVESASRRPCRETSTQLSASRATTRWFPKRDGSWPKERWRERTSSTSVTASCPKPTPMCWLASSSSSTNRPGCDHDRRGGNGVRDANRPNGDRRVLYRRAARPSTDPSPARRSDRPLRRDWWDLSAE